MTTRDKSSDGLPTPPSTGRPRAVGNECDYIHRTCVEAWPQDPASWCDGCRAERFHDAPAPISGEGTGTLTPQIEQLPRCSFADASTYAHGELIERSEVLRLAADVDATLAWKDERIAELEAMQDAFDAGQEASLKGEPRESNPHPPGDSYGVGTLWLQWDDGYDCNINRKLKAELAAKDAQLSELREAKLAAISRQVEALEAEWRRSADATEAELLTIRKDHPEGPRYGISAVRACADALQTLRESIKGA